MDNFDYAGVLLDTIQQVAEAVKVDQSKLIGGYITDNSKAAIGEYKIQTDVGTITGIYTDGELFVGDYVYYMQNDQDEYIILTRKTKKTNDVSMALGDPFQRFAQLVEFKPTDWKISQGQVETWYIEPSERYIYNTLAFQFDIQLYGFKQYIWEFTIVDTAGYIYNRQVTSDEIFGKLNFGATLTRIGYLDLSEIYAPIKAISIKFSAIRDPDAPGTFRRLENIIFKLGQNLDTLAEQGPSVYIYTDDDLNYRTDNATGSVINSARTLKLNWIYKVAEDQYKSVTPLNHQDAPGGTQVKWYRKNENKANGDFYAGAFWELIDDDDIKENDFDINIDLNGLVQKDIYKAIILQINPETKEIMTFESNELEFTNDVASWESRFASTDFKFSDNSNGIYTLWNWSGFLVNNSEYYNQRKITFTYKSELEKEDLFKNLRKITWKLPERNMTMISETAQVDGEYWVQTFKFDGNSTIGSKEAALSVSYFLNDQYLPNNISNYAIIIFEYSNGEVFDFYKDLVFDKSGDGGTANGVIIYLEDTTTGLIKRNIKCGESAAIKVDVYDAIGNILKPVEGSIIYNLLGQNISAGEIDKENGIYTAPDADTLGVTEHFYESIEVKVTVQQEALDSVNIVDAPTPTKEVQSEGETTDNTQNNVTNNITFVDYYPITLVSDSSLGMRGPAAVYYNSEGRLPSFKDEPYALFQNGKEIISGITWSGIAKASSNTQAMAYPELKQPTSNDGKTYYRLVPKDYYESGIDHYTYSIKATYGNNWIYQPVIIKCYNHFSTIIDNWNGKLFINDADGYVLSNGLVAGKKNDKNEFSGVVMGDIKKINDSDPTTTTGIIGYKDGNRAFSLTDDGKVTIGQSGKGQIEINGGTGVGTITGHGGYNEHTGEETQGMTIDLTKGTLTTGGTIIGPNSISVKKGSIGGLKLSEGTSSIQTDDGKIYIGEDGIRIGDFFSATRSGVVISGNTSSSSFDSLTVSSNVTTIIKKSDGTYDLGLDDDAEQKVVITLTTTTNDLKLFNFKYKIIKDGTANNLQPLNFGKDSVKTTIEYSESYPKYSLQYVFYKYLNNDSTDDGTMVGQVDIKIETEVEQIKPETQIRFAAGNPVLDESGLIVGYDPPDCPPKGTGEDGKEYDYTGNYFETGQLGAWSLSRITSAMAVFQVIVTKYNDTDKLIWGVPQRINDFEAAINYAVEKGEVIIDGSTIMAGTIAANQLIGNVFYSADYESGDDQTYEVPLDGYSKTGLILSLREKDYGLYTPKFYIDSTGAALQSLQLTSSSEDDNGNTPKTIITPNTISLFQDKNDVAASVLINSNGNITIAGSLTSNTPIDVERIYSYYSYGTLPESYDQAEDGAAQHNSSKWYKQGGSFARYVAYKFTGTSSWSGPMRSIGEPGDDGNTYVPGFTEETDEDGNRIGTRVTFSIGNPPTDGSQLSYVLYDGADGAQATPTDVLEFMVDNEILGSYSTGSGGYYINASAINGGILTCKDSDGNSVFEANVSTGSCTIGGWTVNKNSISASSTNNNVTTLTMLDGSTGKLTAENAEFSGWRFYKGNLYSKRQGYENTRISNTGSIYFSENSNSSVNLPGVSIKQRHIQITTSGNAASTIFYGDVLGAYQGTHTVAWATIVDEIQTLTSDLRLKNSVEQLDSNYDQFFDLLSPTRYKYNDGTSNRYHTGFIAQEVVSALEASGLTTQDFAAVVLEDSGLETEHWWLRRDEFVALNTWQIQKLKSRVSELEEKVLKLEALIGEKGE